MIINDWILMIEGSLEVKLPTIWADGKAEVGRVREEKRRERVRRKKTQVREKVEKLRNIVLFHSGGSTSRLARAAGADPAGQMRDEKLHAVVARSTFGSQNVQKHHMFGPLLDVEMSKKCRPLWREAHFQVKMLKHHMFGPLLVVLRGRRKRFCTWSKVSKTCGFCSIFKKDGRRGTFEEDLARCIFR